MLSFLIGAAVLAAAIAAIYLLGRVLLHFRPTGEPPLLVGFIAVIIAVLFAAFAWEIGSVIVR